MAVSLIVSAWAWAEPVPDKQPEANVPETAAGAPQQRGFSRPQVSPVQAVYPVRLRVTAYEFQGARADALDPDALAHMATTPLSLLKALGDAGDARILYQIDQEVNVLSEQILIGSAEPVKMAHGETSDPSVNTVTYVNVGLVLHLSGRPAEKGSKPDVTVEAKLSRVRQSNIAPKSKFTALNAFQFNQTKPLEFGHPRVMLGSNSNPATAEDHPSKCVIRYVFEELPKRPADVGTAPPSAQAGSSPDTAQGGFPAHFEVTAYQVKIPAKRIVELDSERLENEAGAAETLLARLAKIGEARITYSTKQTVNVFSDQVMVSTNEWLTTSSRATGPGREPLISRTSQRFGLSVRFAGVRPTQDATRPNVTMLIQSSGLGSSGTTLNPEGNADRTYMRSITHSEVLEFGRPRVMLSAMSFGEPDVATVSVFRYVFSPAAAR